MVITQVFTSEKQIRRSYETAYIGAVGGTTPSALPVKIPLYGFLGGKTHLSDAEGRGIQVSDETRPSWLAENNLDGPVSFLYN